jgi:hypothetical protein
MAEPAPQARRRSERQATQTLLTALAVVALGLAAIWPLFRQPALACTDDLGFHLLRLTQLAHLLDNGILYSRWAPDMALGYGFPFFNFYAPLAYYFAAAVSALGPGLNLGMRLTFALGILGSGLAAYRLARDHFSRPAALTAAAAVMYAPYHGYDVYFRGNLAEALAWPFLALALWAMGRLARRGASLWLPLAALAAAAVLLTHNVFALIFMPLLALYGATEAWFGRKMTSGRSEGRFHGPWQRLAVVVGALLLALGLSAFFWLPAMWEQRYVHIDRLLVPPVFVYWNNFISLGELFALPRAIQPALLNPSPPRGLGLLPALLALPALVSLWRWRDRRRRQVVFFGAALILYAFLMTAASEPLWSSFPLLEFVQFPWRLLGPAAIALAILIAATVELGLELWRARAAAGASLVAGGTIAVLVLSSLFWFDPRYCGGLEEPLIGDLAAYEQATDTIGTTAKGEYLPRTVRLYPPQPVPAPDRFAAATLPDGVQLLQQSDRPLRATALLEAAAPVQITANVFAYPGWRALVDGDTVLVTPEEDYGRVTFALPPGRHEVVVSFGETPLRLAADVVSGATMLVLVLLSWRYRDHKSPSPGTAEGGSNAGFLLLGLALFGVVAGLLPRTANPFYREDLGFVEAPRDIGYQGGMRWHGFNRAVDQPVPSAGNVRYDLFWSAAAPPAANYQTTLHLLDPDGQLWSEKDTTAPRDFRSAPPTSTWLPGQIAQDSHLLAPLPGTPPGIYEVWLLLFDRQTLQPVRPLQNQGQDVTVERLEIGRPIRPATLAELQPQYLAGTTWAPLRLLGYNLDRSEAAPGEPFLLTLFWQAEESSTEAYSVQLDLLSEEGEAVLNRQLPPVRAGFPTTGWRAGDVWRGQHLLRLPAGLESGRYHWRLDLCRGEESCEPLDDPLDLGTLVINAPIRQFDAPAMALPIEAHLGGVATLAGANLTPEELIPGSTLQVSLVWNARQETDTSYHVFLHLLGPEDTVIAQSDGEPASWTRPTTGWLAGEVILDERLLVVPAELPSGDYRLVAGLYEPENGIRLALPDGESAILIHRFTIEP